MPYNDATSTELSTNAILSAAATLDIGPGVKAQDLHRDEFIWQMTHDGRGQEGLKEYRVGEDVAVGLLVPGVRTTKENGATLACFRCLINPLGNASSLLLCSLYPVLIYGIILDTQGPRKRWPPK